MVALTRSDFKQFVSVESQTPSIGVFPSGSTAPEALALRTRQFLHSAIKSKPGNSTPFHQKGGAIMASLSNDGGLRRILVFTPRGKREAIRLGRIPDKQARGILRHVENLAAAAID